MIPKFEAKSHSANRCFCYLIDAHLEHVNQGSQTKRECIEQSLEVFYTDLYKPPFGRDINYINRYTLLK